MDLFEFDFTAICSVCGKEFKISRGLAQYVADTEHYPAEELICPECKKIGRTLSLKVVPLKYKVKYKLWRKL